MSVKKVRNFPFEQTIDFAIGIFMHAMFVHVLWVGGRWWVGLCGVCVGGMQVGCVGVHVLVCM